MRRTNILGTSKSSHTAIKSLLGFVLREQLLILIAGMHE